MAGSITITDQDHRTVRKILLDWLSDAAGAVNVPLTAAVSGIVYRVGPYIDPCDRRKALGLVR